VPTKQCFTVVMDHKYAFGPFQFPKPLPNAATRARWAASLSAPPIKRRADQTGRIHISHFCYPRTISLAKRSRSSRGRPKSADTVEKVFFGCRTKFFRTADASRTRRREGPHRFRQKRPPTFVSALESFAAVETPENRLSRDFRSRSIFDFCNSICQERTLHGVMQINAGTIARTRT
jgi:hypothetical protein